MRRVPEGSHQTPQQGVAHDTYALFVCPEEIPETPHNLSPYVPPRQITLLPGAVQLWEATLGQCDVHPIMGRWMATITTRDFLNSVSREDTQLHSRNLSRSWPPSELVVLGLCAPWFCPRAQLCLELFFSPIPLPFPGLPES